MKRLLLVVLALCVALAVPVMAANDTVPGRVTYGLEPVLIDYEGYMESDNNGARTFNLNNDAWGNQTAQVKVPMSALVPCYLEMEFYGNNAHMLLQSWGPNSSAIGDGGWGENGRQPVYLAFHPEIGGFVDEAWDYIPDSTTNNYQALLPENGDTAAYIRGCDTYLTKLWSNMNYKYTVKVAGGGLTGGIDEGFLPIHMRYAVSEDDPGLDAAVWNGFHNFEDAEEKVLVDGGNFLKSTVIYQQFRVPFNREIQAGRYTGDITFVAATI
ncbi:MAG: hypothetical protein ACOYEP_04560 [Limnochordia bacterium]|jgi:hypothetical protein